MAFPQHSHLMFYPTNAKEVDRNLNGAFLCGIYKARTVESTQPVKKSLISWFRKRSSFQSTESPQLEFVAAANVQEVDKALVVLNIASQQGYGPLLYACLLHLARERRYCGVRPTLKPKDILEKPKKIWLRFSTDPAYAGKVVLKPEKKGKDNPNQESRWQHAEDWLNEIYSLREGAELIEFEQMRKNAVVYWAKCEASGKTEDYLDDFALQMAKRSIDAHQQK